MKIPLLDLLFNMLLGTMALFFLSFIQIAPDAKKESIEPKAEYVIIVSWPGELDNDVDTWLQDPNGDVVWFRNKRTDSTHLDQDDLGGQNDQSPYNQEITTIRALIAGEWILNIHLYAIRSAVTSTPVEITIDRLNPVFKRIIRKTIVLNKHWEEITVARIEMTGTGDVIEINDLPAKLVKPQGDQ